MDRSVGEIVGITTVPGSGIGQLVFRDDDGEVRAVVCEAAQTLRALSALGALNGGASLRVRFRRGLRVRLEVDDLGILASIYQEEDDVAEDQQGVLGEGRR